MPSSKPKPSSSSKTSTGHQKQEIKTHKQIKLEKIEAKKKKEEETREIMAKLASNKLDSAIMNTLISAKDRGKPKKLVENNKDKVLVGNEIMKRKASDLEKDLEMEVKEEELIMKDMEFNIKKEIPKVEPSKINLFELTSYVDESMVLQSEREAKKDNRSNEDKELERTENIIKQEMKADLGVDPFKEKVRVVHRDENLELEEKMERLKEDNNIEIKDDDLDIFIKEMHSKFNHYINRTEKIDQERKKLPIYLRETDIIEAVNNNLITIICGETGSGKSTQTPQFLYERGYSNPLGPNPGKIGITQPRRLAAIALAKRISDEMSTRLGDIVTYQVRHDHASLNEKNRIKFMTDGILLKEMTTDFLLHSYSIIIIDEAHERKVNTDILIGLLSRIVNIRLKLARDERDKNKETKEYKYRYYPLRVIIMSATLRINDFTENKYLFPKNIVKINVEARQYPVTTYFSKVTKDDYAQEALKKCVKIHQKLPQGGILVFLTGQQEIRDFCNSLKEKLKKVKEKVPVEKETQLGEDQQQDRMKLLDLDDDDDENNDNSDLDNDNDIHEDLITNKENPQEKITRFTIIPLFSKLPMHEQERIFKHDHINNRLIVVATNIAETSLTIPGIKYVVDAGKEKKKVYDKKLSISHFKIGWISKASADQRAGRAGRVGPGFCYRLYSTAVYGNIFEQFSQPEIMNMPMENIILQLKAIGIKDILKFPFPSHPDLQNFQIALKNLLSLQALKYDEGDECSEGDEGDEGDEVNTHKGDKNNDKESSNASSHASNLFLLTKDKTKITELGRACSFIPLAARYSKMLFNSRKENCLGYTILITAGLSVEEVFSIDQAIEISDDDPTFLNDPNVNITNPNSHNTSIPSDLSLEFTSLQDQTQSKESQLSSASVAAADRIKHFKSTYKRFIIGSSDLFTLMNMIGDFMRYLYMKVPDRRNGQLIDKAIQEYANENKVLSKNLKAIYMNLMQILNIFYELIESEEEKQKLQLFFKEYILPDHATVLKLQELIVSISLMKIARKIKKNQISMKPQYIYESLEQNMELYIHPSSCLLDESPEFIAYDEIFHTKKHYMKNITKISNLYWLIKHYHLKDKGMKIELLNDPKPFYSKKREEIIVFAQSTFGPKNWTLPCFEYHFEKDDYQKYMWFARLLLEGQLFNQIKAFKSFYNSNPEIIKEGNLSPKVYALINKLKTHQIDNRIKLGVKWHQDKRFLLEEFLNWIVAEYKDEVRKKWPPQE